MCFARKSANGTVFQSTCHYVLENPVRKGLVQHWADYGYTECMVPDYPELDIRTEDYCQRLWRVYAYVRERNTAE